MTEFVQRNLYDGICIAESNLILKSITEFACSQLGARHPLTLFCSQYNIRGVTCGSNGNFAPYCRSSFPTEAPSQACPMRISSLSPKIRIFETQPTKNPGFSSFWTPSIILIVNLVARWYLVRAGSVINIICDTWEHRNVLGTTDCLRG